MSHWYRRLVAGAVAAAFTLAPTAAYAGTRAADSGTTYLSIASYPAGTLPEASWLLPDEDDEGGLWLWVTGGAAFFLLLSAVISNSPDEQNHRSNGAN